MKTAEEVLKEIYDFKTLNGAYDDFKTLHPLKHSAIIAAMEEYLQQSYASQPSTVMSAEQVDTRLLDKIKSIALHNIPYYAFGDNEAACEMSNRLVEIYKLAESATSPSVKADVVKTPHPDKPFIVANVREIMEQYDTDTVSYSRMVEMLNDAVFQWMAKQPSVKADGWVSVEDGLPTEKDADENGKVLIYRNMNEGQKSMSKTIFDWWMVKNCDKTTMWQPLPAPPNVNNNNHQ